jgi:hypothetical protein
MLRISAWEMRNALREQSRANGQTAPDNFEHHYSRFWFFGERVLINRGGLKNQSANRPV